MEPSNTITSQVLRDWVVAFMSTKHTVCVYIFQSSFISWLLFILRGWASAGFRQAKADRAPHVRHWPLSSAPVTRIHSRTL
ncbi:unnamed protein product [Ixodes pacificus]